MSMTRAQAELCAGHAAPKAGFSLIGILMLTEIFYYTFQIWKSCHDHSSPKVATDRISHRRAELGLRRGCRKAGARLSDDEIVELTSHGLEYVASVDTSIVAACCAEPGDIADV